MELTINNRPKRLSQLKSSSSAASKAPISQGKTLQQRTQTDKQQWSQTALSFLQEVNRQGLENQRKLLEQKQKGSSEMDVLTKSLKKMDKCRIIASRIIKGDKVPPQDEKFLMESDPEGYKLALACRQPKRNPKKWDSILEDEDQENGNQENSAPESDAPEESGTSIESDE